MQHSHLETPKDFNNKRGERGNVLFLILIAVTLFAALSYAITQSNRGGGNAADEKIQVSGAQVTQYPAGIQTAVMRLMMNGSTVSELAFNVPGSYGGDTSIEVFHPSGGGAIYQTSSPDVVDDPATDLWVFRSDIAVTNIATTADDLVALLPGLKQSVCQSINLEITGSTAIPVMTGTEANILAGTVDIDDGNTSSGTVDGYAYLCVESSDGEYVYYHVLTEL